MAPIAEDTRRGAEIYGFVRESDWQHPIGPAYECRAILHPEPEGGFSAIAIRLPGVASQGETEEEALANLKEAFSGAVAAYLDDSGAIPWTDEEPHFERTSLTKERWILVDV